MRSGLLGDLLAAEENAEKSWYKVGSEDIPVIAAAGEVRPLSRYSSFVASMKSIRKVMLFVRPEDADTARAKLT